MVVLKPVAAIDKAIAVVISLTRFMGLLLRSQLGARRQQANLPRMVAQWPRGGKAAGPIFTWVTRTWRP
jgi:hypothetical protein